MRPCYEQHAQIYLLSTCPSGRRGPRAELETALLGLIEEIDAIEHGVDHAIPVSAESELGSLLQAARRVRDQLLGPGVFVPLPPHGEDADELRVEVEVEVDDELVQPQGGSCALCGCTEDQACAGGCCWVPHELGLMVDLCSACVELVRSARWVDGELVRADQRDGASP